jgi:hypothetical protein
MEEGNVFLAAKDSGCHWLGGQDSDRFGCKMTKRLKTEICGSQGIRENSTRRFVGDRENFKLSRGQDEITGLKSHDAYPLTLGGGGVSALSYGCC